METKGTKVVLLGNTAVGKSCLAAMFARNEFLDYQEPTIGAAFLTQEIEVNGEKIKFEIWDTAGQERYRGLAPMYYRGAAAAIVVYDVTSQESFDGAKSWVREVRRNGEPDAIIALAGNKCDLPVENRQVTDDEAREYAREEQLLFMETSAKSGKNVNELFEAIGKTLPRRDEVATSKGVDVAQGGGKKKGCCA